MNDRTQHVIDVIDGAVHDWEVSSDAMRWTPEPPRGATVHRAPPTPDHLAAVFRQAAEAFRPVADAFTEMTRRVAPAVEQLKRALAELEAHRAQPPTDVRARALWLAQHRGTGPGQAPAGRQKRPRSLR